MGRVSGTIIPMKMKTSTHIAGLPNLNSEQWNFLATLEALGGPVPIDILDILTPLTPGMVFDLLRKSAEQSLIGMEQGDLFALGSGISTEVVEKIRAINTTKKLSTLAQTILDRKLDKVLDPHMLIGFFERSGRVVEACLLKYELADKDAAQGKLDTAQQLLLSALVRLERLELDKEKSIRFVSRTLQFSNLCFTLGRNFGELSEILSKAQGYSARLGDKRSHALVTLHMGRVYYLTGRRDESFVALSMGLEEVMELGDDDIMNQSAEFMGLYYFMKGQFRECMQHLERIEHFIEYHDDKPPLTFLLFSYGAIYLGQFHRAIGFLDSNMRMAEERSNKGLVSVLRSILGTTLLQVKKYHEAEVHLKKARQESVESGNALGYHFSGGGLALLYFMRGRLDMSHEVMNDTVSKAVSASLERQYASPWILEMAYEFHRLGFTSLPGLEYLQAMEQVLNGVNVHLRGVALRLRAQEIMDQDRTQKGPIMADLEASRECLELSGNRIQQAKTVLEMAHLELLHNNKTSAQEYVHEAWRLFGGYAQDFFPDQYKTLLEKLPMKPHTHASREDFIQRYFEEMNTIKSSMEQEEILNQTVISTNRFFGAERGGLFWFNEGKLTRKPELRAASNLTREEVELPRFRPYLDLVFKTFRTRKPLVIRNDHQESDVANAKIRSVLLIPIEIKGVMRGVLYHDNSYLKDAFDFLDPFMMTLLSRHTSDMIETLYNTVRFRQEREKLSRERVSYRQDYGTCRLVATSPVMSEQLAMAGQVANADTTVLITGETGTGKGVFARWIHEKSPRAEGPFIVVDCTTIPENLVESELFGYEKGAFTGADKRKLGRVELANEGTLFLDEIGELPLSVQVKLLKTIEEKTFIRIGGGRAIHSDFRLIAATNRDLKAEVAAGRFREDLFYRLHVFPIAVPPLRERDQDILELARYFVGIYGRQYGRTDLKLSDANEHMLLAYTWPGNVRELQNVIERAVILSAGSELHIPLFPSGPMTGGTAAFEDQPTLDELQRRYIRHILEATGGRISGAGGAAEILGMKRTSLYSRMRALGMR